MTDKKSLRKSMGDARAKAHAEVDPTPGWIPFVFVIGIAVLFLVAFVFVALFVR